MIFSFEYYYIKSHVPLSLSIPGGQGRGKIATYNLVGGARVAYLCSGGRHSKPEGGGGGGREECSPPPHPPPPPLEENLMRVGYTVAMCE